MQEKSKFLLIVVQSAVIVILLVWLVFTLGDDDLVCLSAEEFGEMQELQEACLFRNDSISLLLQKIRITGAVPPFLDQRQIENLQKKGLANPVDDIRDDLAADPDLIRTSPVLGGRMGFYFRDGIHILNERWVFAYFEDGHVAGALLLRYELGPGGQITWEVLDEHRY